jgi:hypothetical protein
MRCSSSFKTMAAPLEFALHGSNHGGFFRNGASRALPGIRGGITREQCDHRERVGQGETQPLTAGMESFLNCVGVLRKDFGAYARRTTDQLKSASLAKVEELGRPYKYLVSSRHRKEDIVRRILVESPGGRGSDLRAVLCRAVPDVQPPPITGEEAPRLPAPTRQVPTPVPLFPAPALRHHARPRADVVSVHGADLHERPRVARFELVETWRFELQTFALRTPVGGFGSRDDTERKRRSAVGNKLLVAKPCWSRIASMSSSLELYRVTKQPRK